MKYLYACLYALLFTALQAAPIQFKLPATPTPVDKTVAKELKEMFAACFSDSLVIGGKTITEVQVGWTPEAKRRFKTLASEEWRILSDGKKLFIVGGGSRGTYYAAAHFMEDYLDIHYWNVFERYIPAKVATVTLPAIKAGGKPAFISRNIHHETVLPRDGGHYASFNRLNAMGRHDIPAAYGGHVRIGSPEHCHTFSYYFPAEEFGKTHPEYYALIGGKRLTGESGQLCLSNPQVLEITWKKMQKFILADEAKAKKEGIEPPMWYDFSPNDNGRSCECPNCMKIKAEESSEAGLLHRVLRELALRLKKFRPKLYLTTIAYWNNEVVPLHVRPPENVIVRLCNTSQNQVTPISAPGSKVYRDKVTAWGKVAKLGFWEYGITVYDTYYEFKPAYPNEFIMSEQFKFYRDHNAITAFCELQSPEFSDMYSMKAYLLSHLFENPDADFEKLRQTFLTRYYGAAAPFIDEYRQTLWKSAKSHNSQCFTYNVYPLPFDYFDLDTVTHCDKLFEKAIAAVKNDKVLLGRVRRARINLDNAILVYYRQILKEHLAKGGTRENFPFVWDDVEMRYRRARVMAIKENFSHNLDYVNYLKQTMFDRLEMMDKVPYVYPQERTNPSYIEVPVNLAGFFRNRLVPDPESAIGFAAFADYTAKPDYCKLPFAFSGYDGAAMKGTVSSAIAPDDIQGEGYHWYRSPAFTPLPAGFIYTIGDWTIQTPMSAAYAKTGDTQQYYCYYSMKFVGPMYPKASTKGKPGIYVDRIFMVPTNVKFTVGPYKIPGGKQEDFTPHNKL